MTIETDQRRHSPAAERNKEPILDILQQVLPPRGTILEIASGSGQHAVHFAAALPHLIWQPSDPDPDMRRSISAWTAASALPNLRPPLDLDVMANPWPISEAHGILCANMAHISPWTATLNLLRGAAQILASDGLLLLYGPFKKNGQHTANSNAAFDADLRHRNPDWGIRDLGEIQEAAKTQKLNYMKAIPMPANNFMLLFQRVR